MSVLNRNQKGQRVVFLRFYSALIRFLDFLPLVSNAYSILEACELFKDVWAPISFHFQVTPFFSLLFIFSLFPLGNKNSNFSLSIISSLLRI